MKTKFKNIYIIFFSIIFIIFAKIFYQSTQNIIGGGWAFNELFINYSGGLIRRGLLGELFLITNNNFNTNPLIFFSIIFISLHSILLILYYKILKSFKDLGIFFVPILFSPVLIFFPIYEHDVYYVKDILTNLSILLHVFYITKNKKNFELVRYQNFLTFILIPLIIFNLFNHENQFFFISVHFLISVYVGKNNYQKNIKSIYKSYLILLLPILIVIFTQGSWEKLAIINESIERFGASINPQLAGNINLAIGGFIKWHFFFHSIDSFINFFICLILSVGIIYFLFGYLINKKILILKNNIKINYLYFFIPSLGLFIFALDYGRNLNLIATHLIAFYSILNFDTKKLRTFKSDIKSNFISYRLTIVFTIFYCFMWYLPQGGGYSGIADFTGNSSILKNTLLNELKEIFMIMYNFIDNNLFNLPKIII